MERKWWTLVVVCVAIFMLLLDITVVNVALPDIQRELDANFSDTQWVIDAYALTLAALLLTAGSLADRLGRRRVFVVGLVALHRRVAAAAGCRPTRRSSTSPAALQGIGGAIMFAHLARPDRAGVRGPRARHGAGDLGRDDRRGRRRRAARRRRCWSRRWAGSGSSTSTSRSGSPRLSITLTRVGRVARSRGGGAIDWPGVVDVLGRAVRARSSRSCAATPRAGARR